MVRSGKRNKGGRRGQAIDVGQSLNGAVQHHRAGQLHEAEQLYRQVLQADPRQPDALYLLGLLAFQSGQHASSVELLTKAIAITPERSEVHCVLGKAYTALHDFEHAQAAFGKAISLNPSDVEASFHLGILLNEFAHYEQAIEKFEAVLKVKPGLCQALNNIGHAYMCLGRLDTAMETFERALASDPKFSLAVLGGVNVLKKRGELEKTISFVEGALKNNPQDPELMDLLAELLNHVEGQAENDSALSQAHQALQSTHFVHADGQPITDDMVVELYQAAEEVLMQHNSLELTRTSQIWRGRAAAWNCPRHLKLFKTHNAIAEYCFSCFKLSIEVGNVVELMKLAWLYDGVELPNDNSRKCHIELRENIKGAYKGLVYSRSLEEAKELQALFQSLVDEKIRPGIEVVIKRGCSEFPLAYPEYNQFDANGEPVMDYNQDWRTFEDMTDQAMAGQEEMPYQTNNHDGITLQDARILRTWLAYAAGTGDPSVDQFCAKDLPKLNLPHRPRFKR
ncbi:tetratricopeptide repeat protein [Magnetovibrio sp. PR-2]|uniref:tetratricopeptide repeat protein n=1 Tax=Magnetovibrio sp. PR-2 TaxID=3120356 RepID=UPI002FCE3ECC